MDPIQMGGGDTPKKKSEWLKWTLIGCGGLLAIIVALGGIGAYLLYKNSSMTEDPGQAEAAAQEILRFDKPQGFRGLMAGSILGMKGAVLTAEGGEDQGGIALLRFPAVMSVADAERQFRTRMTRDNDAGIQEPRPPETFTVRGREVTAEVMLIERKSVELLQYMLTLNDGDGNLVLVIVGGPEATATHDWVQDILSTVR